MITVKNGGHRLEEGTSLRNKRILVTGVSRSMGIGAAITSMLAQAGAQVVTHGFTAYDGKMGYPDASGSFAEDLAKELASQGHAVHALPSSDLSAAGVPEAIIRDAAERLGYLDGMVLNHAYSTLCPIGEWTASHIDAHLNANVRAAMLLIQAFAGQLPADVAGVVTLFTSGQYLGPMTKEIAYAVSKDAVIGLCRQAAAALAPRHIRVNCINPGPTDTGYLRPEDTLYEEVAQMFPSGRWGMPEDAARLVRFLHSEDAAWITGQVLSSEGGFNRFPSSGGMDDGAI
jgi:3-oxoacyl-[acyl-carrier protein] reductase